MEQKSKIAKELKKQLDNSPSEKAKAIIKKKINGLGDNETVMK